MKKCGQCGEEKPLSMFNKKGSGYQNKCRPCQKEWYQRYYQSTPNEKERLQTRNKQLKTENRKRLQEIKESTPCYDCGNIFPYWIMDFDHLDNKKDSVSRMLNHTWQMIEKELEKCELVCANCHRTRTHSRIAG